MGALAVAKSSVRALYDPRRARVVPAEFVGRARHLINRVNADYGQWQTEAEALLLSLVPRAGFRVRPRVEGLRNVARAWDRLPALGRVISSAKVVGRRLSIIEFRARPLRMSLDFWRPGSDEITLEIFGRGIEVDLPRGVFKDTERCVVSVGIHALARRFERSLDRRDESVLSDLVPLVVDGASILANGDEEEVRIVVESGSWRGNLVNADGNLMITIRTFYDE